MKVVKIKYNDTVDTDDGITVSVWFQGCTHRCPGCHNQELWDYNDGVDRNDEDVIREVIAAINANITS